MKFRRKLALYMVCVMSILLGAGGSLLILASFSDSLERERQNAWQSYQSVLGTLQLVCSVRQPSDYDGIALILEQFPDRGAGWEALRLYSRSKIIYQSGTFPQEDSAPRENSALQEARALQENPASQEDSAPPAVGSATPGTVGSKRTAFPMRGPELPNHSNMASFLDSLSEICTIRQMNADRMQFLAVLGAIDVSSETLYLEILYDITPVFTARTAQLRVYGWVFLLFILLCTILAFVLSYALTRPLTKLSEASRDIASGQLFCRARIYTDDEIGQVAQDFNIMADSLEQTIMELEESVKRQKRFTGSFAHEVKTPMTSIIGYADLIRGGTLDQEEQRQAANYIFLEGRRLEHLSRKLLQLQMLQKGKMTLSRAEPARLLASFAGLWKPVYELQGIAITCEGEEGSCLLEPDLVKTLLINLWDNARKAGAKQITVHCGMTSEGCRFTVQDDGQGIPPEALPYLTEEFFRVDRSRSRLPLSQPMGGAGLGLSLCQEIVGFHNGSIRFESEPGSGTTVTVDLKGGRL